jgi:uncharacterized protein YciI
MCGGGSAGISGAGPVRPKPWCFAWERYRQPLMFVVLLSYIRPIPEVDALMREHVAWLNEHYDADRFVVSGRRVPRTGGVIVALGDDRDEIERIVASDPLVSGGVATSEVIHFRASQTADGFEARP